MVRADYGGAQEHLLTLLQGLRDGFDLYVACPQDQPYWELYKTVVREEKMLEIPHRQFSLKSLFALRRWVLDSQVETVHSHGKGAGLYSRLLKLLVPGLKVVHTFHGLHFQQYGAFMKQAYFTLERCLARLTDVFVNVSNGEREQALRLDLFPAGRSQVIYNGVRTGEDHERELPEIDGIEPGDFVVMNISRFDYPKNLKMLLDIAAIIFSVDPKVKFLLIGDGPERNELEEIVSRYKLSNVIFAGFQPLAAGLLTSAEAYLSTSRWEGMPIAVLEAMARGLPVVASDVIGNNEAVLPGETGLLFPLEQPQLAVDSILKLKADSDLRRCFSENAKIRYQEHFRVETMVCRTADIYLRLRNDQAG